MTDTAWKPTPGRDAMTRDGRRVHLHKWAEGQLQAVPSEGGLLAYVVSAENGRALHGVTSGWNLVSDWPDADPLPDADGWRCPECGCRSYAVPEFRADNGDFAPSPTMRRCLDCKHVSIVHVRPAPSGPVVEETVKRIVPGVYGRLRVWEETTDHTGDRVARVTFASRNGGHSMGGAPVFLNRAELLAISETTRQIGEAMEGK